MPPPDAALAVSFPGGRYAATPWFRSRREHVGNVEWPPSPWRIGRALVTAADRFGDAPRKDAAARLVVRLAAAEPEYELPEVAPLTYTQWMPALEFDDGGAGADRLDNGHYLLDLDPDAALVVRWPGVRLDEDERALLETLAGGLTYLGQSVAVADARLLDDAESPARRGRGAWPARDREPEPDEAYARLLAPTEDVTLADLVQDTRDGLSKSLPAPHGARWVDYVVPALVERAAPTPAAPRPATHRYWLRLSGALRPPVLRPDDPLPPDDRRFRADRLVEALRDSSEGWKRLGRFELELHDHDGDGRAELAALVPETPLTRRVTVPASMSATVCDAGRRRVAQVECDVAVEHVERAAEGRAGSGGSLARLDARDPAPVLWRVRSAVPPLLADAVTVAEAAHRAILSVAGRRFGSARIPEALSGRGREGTPLRGGHGHKHVLVGSRDGATISDLAVWAPAGLTDDERAVVEAIRLPPLAAARVRLEPSGDHPAFATSSVWVTLLPFLPTRHPKRRGDRIVDAPVDQVRRELVAYRGLPEPEAVELVDRDWSHVRTLRRGSDRSSPGLGRWGVRVRFPDPVAGPIAIGANAHFSMGLLVPEPEG
jgi:hypothetical protein